MLMTIVSRISLLLRRRRPVFRFSWRFFFPCAGYIQIHRKVLLSALQQRPWLILPFSWSLFSWYFCWFWVTLYSAMHRLNRQAVDDGVPTSRQVFGLLRAGLGQGISGFDYYHFKLYQVPPKLWWQYVFDFQLPYFHHAFQFNPISPSSRAYLSNKATFAKRLSAAGGHPVVTLDSVSLMGDWPVEDWLGFSDQIFIKPESASRSMGCVSLSKHGTDWRFNFSGQQYTGKEGLSSLKSLLPVGRYMVQPLLEHHPEMASWQSSDTTITLRIISCIDYGPLKEGVSGTGQFKLVCGNLELNDDANRRFRVFAIDISDGGVMLEHEYCAEIMGVRAETRVIIPFWQALCDEIALAHSLCADVHTVGWDAVVTATGVVLLEGNINWGLNPLQRAAQVPLLPLLSVCSSRFAVTPAKEPTTDLR